MKRLGVFLSSALVVIGSLAATPADAQGASKRCANGYPEWANDVFSNRRQTPNFRCEAAPQSEQQVAAPKAAAQKRQPAAPAAAVAAQPAKAVDTTPTASADVKDTPKSATPSKPQCRRYLASTGQTVEVPCS